MRTQKLLLTMLINIEVGILSKICLMKVCKKIEDINIKREGKKKLDQEEDFKNYLKLKGKGS